jgi:hypothetical protein
MLHATPSYEKRLGDHIINAVRRNPPPNVANDRRIIGPK